jgi:hypothetical protein
MERGHFPAIQRVRSTSQLADNYSGDVVSTLRYPATNFRHNSARNNHFLKCCIHRNLQRLIMVLNPQPSKGKSQYRKEPDYGLCFP